MISTPVSQLFAGRLGSATNQHPATQQSSQPILDAIFDSIIMTDRHGRIKQINLATQRLLGFAPIALYDRHISMVICEPQVLQLLQQNAIAQLDTDAPTHALLEVNCANQQGDLIAMECACTLLPAELEINQGYVYTLRDIRDRQVAEARLIAQTKALIQANQTARKAIQLKSDFIATVSHEIRTPINAIVGITELIQNTPLDREQREYIQTIQASSDVLLSLINDILDVSKLESGHLAIHRSPFDLRHCLKGSIAIFQHTARQKQLDLQFSINPNVPQIIHSDQQRINQILINLLGNAIKFTHAGLISLDVSAQDRGDNIYEIYFSITDTGCGIAPEQTKHLFQPFYQAHAAIAQQYGGTGLGLSISKQLTTLLGGTIGVESEIGRGSKFTFSIVTTAVPSSIETLAVPRDSTTTIATHPRLKILIAEDNPINQKLLLKMLRHFGYEADMADNGRQVLRLLETQNYDLILMDCQMPELNGYETTAAIHRKFAPADRPKIVAITAQSQAHDRQRCQAIGMDGYLNKPIRLADLGPLLKQYEPVQPSITQSPAASNAIDHQVLLELQKIGGTPRFVPDMIHCYLRQSHQLIADIQTAFAQSNIPRLIALAHTFSGSSSTIGALRLAAQCEAIAQQDTAIPDATLQQQIDQIQQEWVTVQQALQQELPQSWA